MRGGRPGIRGALIQVEPRMSLTGASADEWVAIKPGTEGILALGLANALGAKDVEQYTPAIVEQQTGVKAARVERLAQMLEGDPAGCRGRRRRAARALRTACSRRTAVNTLNQTLGAVDAPGGAVVYAARTRAKRRRTVAARVRAPTSSRARHVRCKSVLVDGVNPGPHDAARLEGEGRAREDPLHRQLRQLRRRHERDGGSDPARSLGARVVDRLAARDPGTTKAIVTVAGPVDEAAARHARDARTCCSTSRRN